jgi:osmotically-inducible protein OsmY
LQIDSIDSDESNELEAKTIVETARQRLRKQSHLSVQRIWCEFDEGSLILRGQVPSFYHKQLAQVAVAGMKGVAQVVNDIEVVW